MAFDQRFAMGLIASSGAGGTKLYRRNFGESLENLASSGAYHWMAGNYIKYSAEEATFGRRTAADLPVDSHMTLALCAPRLTFISHGDPGTRRCQVARSSGQLHGRDRGPTGVPIARRS